MNRQFYYPFSRPSYLLVLFRCGPNREPIVRLTMLVFVLFVSQLDPVTFLLGINWNSLIFGYERRFFNF